MKLTPKQELVLHTLAAIEPATASEIAMRARNDGKLPELKCMTNWASGTLNRLFTLGLVVAGAPHVSIAISPRGKKVPVNMGRKWTLTAAGQDFIYESYSRKSEAPAS